MAKDFPHKTTRETTNLSSNIITSYNMATSARELRQIFHDCCGLKSLTLHYTADYKYNGKSNKKTLSSGLDSY